MTSHDLPHFANSDEERAFIVQLLRGAADRWRSLDVLQRQDLLPEALKTQQAFKVDDLFNIDPTFVAFYASLHAEYLRIEAHYDAFVDPSYSHVVFDLITAQGDAWFGLVAEARRA